MASCEGGNINDTTKTKKRKIEIKKVEDLNKLHVTFSKRKTGLFNKATELAILCQAKIALILTSPNNNLYVCGYPTVETVIHDFLSEENPSAVEKGKRQQDEEAAETVRLRYEELQERLKEEKKKLQALKEAQKSVPCCSSSSWWNLSIDNMDLEGIEEFKIAIENLKLSLITTLEEKRFSSLVAMPSKVLQSLPPPPCDYFEQQQIPVWSNEASGSGSGSYATPSFDHYYINN